jgi:pimeloyl-ACP methyl ester carboxylesterase
MADLTAQEWFALGTRVPHDRGAKKILGPGDSTDSPHVIHVFRRTDRVGAADERASWTTLLPGFPDGSFGWAKIDQQLGADGAGSKLYVEYVGQGDSDKPRDYPYGTMERADLVESLWEAEGIGSSLVVAFDFSSLVALELLSRQGERLARDRDATPRITGVLLINGGLFADAHSHPWFATPLFKSPIGGLITWFGQRSRFAFMRLYKPLFAKEYRATSDELNESYEAISRRNGVAVLSKMSGFVDEHRANSERWDLRRVFLASREDVSFLVVGSEGDQFEPDQIVKARERVGGEGLDIRTVPGGHQTIVEHPELFGSLIRESRAR